MNFNIIDTTFFFILMGGMVAVMGLILAVYGIATWIKRTGKIGTRIDQFVAPDFQTARQPDASPIVAREMSGSFLSRMIGTGLNHFVNFLGRFAPQKMVANLEHQLPLAGNPGNLHAGSFFALKLLFLGGSVLLAYMLNRDLTALDFNNILLGLLIILMGWLLPSVWLKGRVRSRQDEITRGLPDALDMLSVCASAGLGFDQSLQKISQYWDTELGYELRRVTHEMEMGISRAEALRNMSKRLDVDDLTRFIATIVQAERIGMSYADVLHSQALQMRVLRQLRAREIANKLPGKMIIPVALFIFPAIMAVILGPVLPVIFDALFGAF